MTTSNWRCLSEKSTTGAHHWIYASDDSARECKFCGQHEVLKVERLHRYSIAPWTFTEVPLRRD